MKKRKIDKVWYRCFLIGIIFGIAISFLNFFINSLCLKGMGFCWLNKIVQFIAYFPTIYILLYNALGFVNQNKLIMIMFLIIPILQYSMIGSVIGIILKKAKTKKE